MVNLVDSDDDDDNDSGIVHRGQRIKRESGGASMAGAGTGVGGGSGESSGESSGGGGDGGGNGGGDGGASHDSLDSLDSLDPNAAALRMAEEALAALLILVRTTRCMEAPGAPGAPEEKPLARQVLPAGYKHAHTRTRARTRLHQASTPCIHPRRTSRIPSEMPRNCRNVDTLMVRGTRIMDRRNVSSAARRFSMKVASLWS